MEDTRANVALNSLIDVNNKRMKAYQSFAEKTRQSDLKALFYQWADQSKHFSRNLSTWRAAYGGFPVDEKTSGISNAWSQVKSLLDIGLNKNVMTQCKELEHSSLKAYKSTIEASVLPIATVVDIERQRREFEKALAKLSVLKV